MRLFINNEGFRKGSNGPKQYQKIDWSWTETNRETWDLLMNTLFPGCVVGA